MESEIDEWNQMIEAMMNSSERRNLIIGVRIAGILTILGAGYIIQDIVKDAARRKPTKNRIMLVMSSCDFLQAIVNTAIGPVMIPKGIGVPGAVGNQLTCDIQGFVALVTGPASALYNVSLALCYLLIVCYEYSDEKLYKLEPYFLYLPMIVCLVIAISGLPFGIYNFTGFNACFIKSSPLGCDTPESPIECERGDLYMYWRYLCSIMMSIGACIIIFCMVKMYTAVLNRERSGDRFRFSIAWASRSSFITSRAAATTSNATSRRPRSMRHRDLSRAMRSQGLWYSGSYLFTFLPLGLQFVFQIESLVFFVLITFQLVGFTNAVIYFRPKFLKFRRNHRNIGVVSSIWYTLTRKRPPAASTTSRDVNNRRIQESSSPPPQFLLLDRLSSGMASLRAGMKRWMTSDSDAALASAEKNDPINTSSRPQVVLNNHVNDENCSVICEREEGGEEQQDEEFLLCEVHHSIEKGGSNDADIETNDGIGIRNQGMVENDATCSGRGVLRGSI